MNYDWWWQYWLNWISSNQPLASIFFKCWNSNSWGTCRLHCISHDWLPSLGNCEDNWNKRLAYSVRKSNFQSFHPKITSLYSSNVARTFYFRTTATWSPYKPKYFSVQFWQWHLNTDCTVEIIFINLLLLSWYIILIPIL